MFETSKPDVLRKCCSSNTFCYALAFFNDPICSQDAQAADGNATDTSTHTEPPADELVWIRSVGQTASFARYLLGNYDEKSHAMGVLANEVEGNGAWKVYSPNLRHGLYAIDTLAPNWIIKVTARACHSLFTTLLCEFLQLFAWLGCYGDLMVLTGASLCCAV